MESISRKGTKLNIKLFEMKKISPLFLLAILLTAPLLGEEPVSQPAQERGYFSYTLQYVGLGSYSKYKAHINLFYQPYQTFDIGLRLTPIVFGKTDLLFSVCLDFDDCNAFRPYASTGYGIYFRFNSRRFHLEAVPYLEYYIPEGGIEMGLEANVSLQVAKNIFLNIGGGAVWGDYLPWLKFQNYGAVGISLEYDSPKRGHKIAGGVVTGMGLYLSGIMTCSFFCNFF